MPKLPDIEPTPAGTPGITEYKIDKNPYFIASDPRIRRLRLCLRLSPEFNSINKATKAFVMLKEKSKNSFIQKLSFYSPRIMTISWETEVDRAIFEADKKIIESIPHSEQEGDESGYLSGYETTFEKEGWRGFRAVRFLPNGVKIVLSATRPRKGLLSRWSPISAEVSVGISKRLSEEEAREHLEAFAHAPY